MPVLRESTPKYRKHKASGQAIVTIQGSDFYLGPWNSNASKVEYDRIIAEWLAAGRQLPLKGAEASDLTVVEMLARYRRFAMTHYRKNNIPTGEFDNIPHGSGTTSGTPSSPSRSCTVARWFGILVHWP